MQLGKFEEKATAFISENNMFVPLDENLVVVNSMFKVNIESLYKEKSLGFYLYGLNHFHFVVYDTNVEDLFDKAFRVLKSYGPKATRTKSEDAVENKGKQE